jgi:phage/plasmid-like protein (TIGR03299 family)
MSHNLMRRDDNPRQTAMFSVGEAPWHHLGTRFEHPPASAAEAIGAAGLNWEVVKVPLYVARGRRMHAVAQRFAIMRPEHVEGDTCRVLGIVGGQYEPLQNRDAFGFFDGIIAGGSAAYHTAGALGDGERIWVLVKLTGVIHVAKDDEVQKFLLLTSTHDGSGAVRALFTPVRVVCQNTLSQALGRGGGISVPHVRGMAEALAQAREVMGRTLARYRDMEEVFARMCAYRLTQVALRQYLGRVFPEPPLMDSEASHRASELARHRRAWAEMLFEAGAGNDRSPVKGSLWAAYNGVTELIDHGAGRVARQVSGGVVLPDSLRDALPEAPLDAPSGALPPATAVRGVSGWSRDERRLESVWFGDGARLKAHACDEAVALFAGGSN